MTRYEVKLKRQLRVDTETLEAGTVIATVESDQPLRLVASLILNRGIVIGEQQVEVEETGNGLPKKSKPEATTEPAGDAVPGDAAAEPAGDPAAASGGDAGQSKPTKPASRRSRKK